MTTTDMTYVAIATVSKIQNIVMSEIKFSDKSEIHSNSFVLFVHFYLAVKHLNVWTRIDCITTNFVNTA